MFVEKYRNFLFDIRGIIVMEKLNKLNLLKANGILSEDEYQKEKAKLGL